jgi:hypothetical protein
MITTSKWLGLLAAAIVAGVFFTSPVPQAIAAVIASDVVCTGCVGTSDLAGNAVTAAKIKDGEVKAAEIAADAVGASELQGVSKILFGKCPLTSTQANAPVTPGGTQPLTCNIQGVDGNDAVVAILNGGSSCFDVSQAFPSTNAVNVYVRNECDVTISVGSSNGVSVIVFDK